MLLCRLVPRGVFVVGGRARRPHCAPVLDPQVAGTIGGRCAVEPAGRQLCPPVATDDGGGRARGLSVVQLVATWWDLAAASAFTTMRRL